MSAIYEVKTWLHNQVGNFFQNTFHYDHPESAAVSPWQHAKNLATQWITDVVGDYLKLMGTDVVFDFLTARKVSGGGGPTATEIVNLVGTGGALSMSAGLCADIQWICQNPNNRMGHCYIGGVPDGALFGDIWQIPFPADCGTFITTILANLVLPMADGSAVFGTYTKKTGVIHTNEAGELRPKPTCLNKRTVPVF